MRTPALLILAALPLMPALAKDPPPRRVLFISPMGQPYRTDDGLPENAWFTAVDRDGDGRITMSEFTLDAARFFALLDTNHDGVISPDEVQHYEHDIAPEIEPRRFGDDSGGEPFGNKPGGSTDGGGGHHRGGGMGGGGMGGGGMGGGPGGGMGGGGGMDGGPGGGMGGGGRHGGGGGQGGGMSGGSNGYMPPLQGAGRYGYIATPEPVSAADVNFDGTITRSEYMAAASRRFEMLDANQDGALTQRELPKLKANPDRERRRPMFDQDRPQGETPSPPE